MSDETTLLPCPFCGGEATVQRIGKSGYYYVACNTAYCCDFGKFDTEAEAITAWNTRAELGSGTCNPVETEVITYYDEYGHDAVKVHVIECDECGDTYEHINGDYERCPRCGKAVRA